MPHGNFKRKEFRNTSFKLLWKNNNVLDYQWKWSSRATVQQHGLYRNAERKGAQSGKVVDMVKTLIHPQKPAIPHIKECEQNRTENTGPEFGESEATVGISVNEFYGQDDSDRVGHKDMVTMNNKCSRQEEEGQDVSPHQQTNHSVQGEAYNIHINHHSLITGVRQSVKRTEGTSVETHPCQSQNNRNKQFHSQLCSRNGRGTLYECLKCRRKFASKYNLLVHQQLCV